jgi:hypothetical protein
MTDLQKLAERVADLKAQDKLLVAIGLIEKGELELAETIVQLAADQLRLAKMIGGK